MTRPSTSKAFIPLPVLTEHPPERPRLDLEAIRRKLAGAGGREYWRSLDELADTEEFRDYLQHEFPREADAWMEPISRRAFLKIMGASLAMAFFSGCRKPLGTIIPYNQQPEEIIPGKPLYFASALPFSGHARGVLVESHLGRPTKIEGNPEHPDSLGATDIFMQAATLSLYDPDRSQVVTSGGMIQTWDNFFNLLRAEAAKQQAKEGAGLRVLTETITSPAMGRQLKDFQKQFPKSRWHQFEPVARDAVREGARLAFGRAYDARYQFDKADVVLALDADFLTDMPGSLRYARDFSQRRQGGLNRLYVVETTPTVTGGMADHRLPLGAKAIEAFARRLARELHVSPVSSRQPLPAAAQAWMSAVARDLSRHRGAGLVLAGYSQPPVVHALAHAINERLANNGQTVVYSRPAEVQPVNQGESLSELARDAVKGQVDLLLILGGNPVYTAPADLRFAEALSKVKTSVHLSLYDDETSARCRWHLPEAHPLESWGDLRAYDGTVSLIQPLIEPLYGGKTPAELLSALLDASPRSSRDIVHGYWEKESHAVDFEKAWRKSLHDGVVTGTAFEAESPPLRGGFASQVEEAEGADGLEIVFRPDPSIWDGRFANNGWLQELPKPLTKLTWDNAALVSPALAQRLGVTNEDLIELEFQSRAITAPVWIQPGQAEESITLTLGYGRTRAGRVGNDAGYNAYALRTSEALWHGAGARLRKTGNQYRLAATQHHYSIEGRDLVRVAALSDYEKNPHFAQRKEDSPAREESLYNYSPPKQSDEYAWAMAIDLNQCTGCNACVIACQAENNIPIVGKDQVARGREMHWIRVDRYYAGDPDNPASYSQPVPCMHCEDAPCEVVCPVGATMHSEEGLNQMIYNRCVGTRYCSNNCPYKVRRFNFLDYTRDVKGPLELLQNPDVTVRSRGVMEKCTYCVQRIQGAKIAADKEGRLVRDGEVVPACAQACPSQAIVFGNLLDKNSRVTQKKTGPRDYALLGSLGLRPRTTYQARLKNPNPEIGGS